MDKIDYVIENLNELCEELESCNIPIMQSKFDSIDVAIDFMKRQEQTINDITQELMYAYKHRKG